MEERRQEPRGPSYLGASIALTQRSATLPCTVRNLTAQGAKIHFSDAVPLPQDIHLAVPSRGLTLRARVVWRADGELGVRFDDVRAPQGGPVAEIVSLKEVRRLKAARAENDALKRRIEELTSGI